MRDMAGDAAQRAAVRIKPSEEDMAGIDEPAEENVWHDKPDFKMGKFKSQVKSQVGHKKEKVSLQLPRACMYSVTYIFLG